MKIARLPYRRNSAELFGLIAAEEWAIFLDSAYPYIDKGRYDIFSARPYKTLLSYGKETTIQDGGARTVSEADPFALVRRALGEKTENFSGLLFCGGALGYFAYDLGRRIEVLPALAKRDLALPDMALGLYDWAVVVDHHQRSSCLLGYGRHEQTHADWPRLLELFHSEPRPQSDSFAVCSAVQANMDRTHYARAFARIKNHIHDGDCYQVNLAQRFSVGIAGDPWAVYLQLRQKNPAPFSGFMRLPDEQAILSSSPERFIRVRGGQVSARPIKGTRQRASQPHEDQRLAQQLLASEKDRAENLMIVDLLRNDIGKNCTPGSIHVPELFALETYATVHHLVSTVVGQLAQDRTAVDLLRGCFPGGSITGAPKLRAMEIIEALEPHRRHVYCGAMGYIGFDGNMDTNIAIRTLAYCRERIYFWGGGGIVADSELAAEYEECLSKVAAIAGLFALDKNTDTDSDRCG